MTLAEQLYGMMQRSQEASQPTDLTTGTVTSTSPLEITLSTSMAPLRGSVLSLTASVVERKIPVLAHSHTTAGLSHAHAVTGLAHTHTVGGSESSQGLDGSYATETALVQDAFQSSEALQGVACVENGQALPVENGYILLNRGLAVGDKVLLLRAQHGQKYLVLSRIFEVT